MTLESIETNKEVTGDNGKATTFWPTPTFRLAKDEPSAIPQDLPYQTVTSTEKESDLWRERRSRVQFRSDQVLRIPAKKEILEHLGQTFIFITDACDTTLGLAERSNSFDDWTDKLELLARKAKHFNINHNTILGSMIAATSDCDISDFSTSALKSFLNATNLLRNSSLTRRDSSRVITSFIDLDLKITWSLKSDEASENGRESGRLDGMMQALLKKSRPQK